MRPWLQSLYRCSFPCSGPQGTACHSSASVLHSAKGRCSRTKLTICTYVDEHVVPGHVSNWNKLYWFLLLSCLSSLNRILKWWFWWIFILFHLLNVRVSYQRLSVIRKNNYKNKLLKLFKAWLGPLTIFIFSKGSFCAVPTWKDCLCSQQLSVVKYKSTDSLRRTLSLS